MKTASEYVYIHNYCKYNTQWPIASTTHHDQFEVQHTMTNLKYSTQWPILNTTHNDQF